VTDDRQTSLEIRISPVRGYFQLFFSYPIEVDSSTLQGAYIQIRDSVNKIVLPSRLSIGDTGPNVRGEARKSLNFVRKCAGYTQTMLRVMKSVSDKAEAEEGDWDSLYTCIAALHRLLQAEQVVCVYEGSGVPSETVQLYRFPSKNSAISTADTVALENATRLTTAINLAKGQSKSDGNNSRGNFGGRRFNGNFRGRGGFNSRGFI
jgi:hypothetical protein